MPKKKSKHQVILTRRQFNYLKRWAICGLDWERGAGNPELFTAYDLVIKKLKKFKPQKL